MSRAVLTRDGNRCETGPGARTAERLRTIVLAALTLAPGCIRYTGMELDPGRGAAALEARSLASEDLHAFVAANLHRPVPSWPLQSWDLETLTLAAFFYSPDLDVVRAQWGSAKAAGLTAAARPNPNIALTPERAVHQLGAPSPWVASVAIDIPIETAGKRGYRIAKAASLTDAARKAIGITAWKVRGRLRDALFDREAALGRHDLLHARVLAQRATLDLYEKRVSAGAASRADADATRLALQRATSDETQGEALLATATATVAAAIGVPASALDDVKLAVPLDAIGSTTELPATEVRRRALEVRADVLAALDVFEAAQDALQLEIAKQYPDVHLGSGYSYDQGNEKWNVGLSADIPVFDQNEGPIAEAESARREAVALFVFTQTTALSDVDTALAATASARKGVADADAAAATASLQLERMNRALAAGSVDRVDAAVAKADALDSALAAVDARLLAAKAFGKLEDAVQAPLGIDLEQDPRRESATTGVQPAETKR